MAAADVETFIMGMPKAELHLHIEGTLEPELMFEIGRRNGISLPYSSAQEAREAYNFTSLRSFLDLYYLGTTVLIKSEDFYDMTWAYLKKAAEQGLTHVEMSFDPQAHIPRGVSLETALTGIHRAAQDAEEKLGMHSGIIMSFMRDRPAEEAMQVLESSIPYKDRIIAVGLDSDERGNPPVKFEKVFAKAGEYGFHKTAHAGEEGPADNVRDSLDLLGVSRIDHGYATLDDPSLVDRMVRAQTPLTICPLSSIKLQVVNDINDHPVKEMMAKGMAVSIHSDDPAYFGGYVHDNFVALQKALSLTTSQLSHLARNSFHASFLSDAKRAEFLESVDHYVSTRGGL